MLMKTHEIPFFLFSQTRIFLNPARERVIVATFQTLTGCGIYASVCKQLYKNNIYTLHAHVDRYFTKKTINCMY